MCQIQTGRREHQGNSFDRKWLPSFRRQPVLVPPVLYPEAGLQYAGYEGADDNWNVKREEMAVEHLFEKAADDLRSGWKAWLVDSMDSGDCANSAAVAVPATVITLIIRD